jgi:hypothetical protein
MINPNTLATHAKLLGWSEPSSPSDSDTDTSSCSSEYTGLQLFYPTPESLMFHEDSINVVKLGTSWCVSEHSFLPSSEVIQLTGISIPLLTHAPMAQFL